MLGHNVIGRDNSKVRAPAMAGIDAQATERLLCGSSSERGTEWARGIRQGHGKRLLEESSHHHSWHLVSAQEIQVFFFQI